MLKTYLGDGVYAEISEDGDIMLTTGNGIRTTNSIYLDRAAIDALIVFINHTDRAIRGYRRALDFDSQEGSPGVQMRRLFCPEKVTIDDMGKANERLAANLAEAESRLTAVKSSITKFLIYVNWHGSICGGTFEAFNSYVEDLLKKKRDQEERDRIKRIVKSILAEPDSSVKIPDSWIP